MKRAWIRLGLLAIACLGATAWAAETVEAPHASPVAAAVAPVADTGPVPEAFGANLFSGNFRRTREDALNPLYRVVIGDQVSVKTWGSVTINDVYTVDAQGNIFLPDIGPVRVEGVENRNLSEVVRAKIKQTFINNFDVYTNVVSTQPVAVYVAGLVNNPGRYAGAPSDSVLYFLDLAGGIDPNYGSYRDIRIRRNGKTLATIDLYDFILAGNIRTPQLRDGDVILVGKRGPVVTLSGEVDREYSVELSAKEHQGRHVFSVITPRSSVTEVTIQGIRERVPVTYSMNLAKFDSFPLSDGDRLVLRADGRADTVLVSLQGEFEGPSVLSVTRGARLLDVLAHVPVNPEHADVESVHILRKSVAKAQRESINDSLLRLERDALLALSDSTGEAEIRVVEADLTQRFVEKAKLIEPLGRVVTSQQGAQQNIMLEPDDVLVIPLKTSVIRVSGQVAIAQAVTYNPAWTVEDYIRQAGGFSDRAQRDQIFLMRPNAAVELVGLDSPIKPGDEIVVPPRIDNKTIQNASDIMQVIYKVAVSARVLVDF